MVDKLDPRKYEIIKLNFEKSFIEMNYHHIPNKTKNKLQGDDVCDSKNVASL